MSAPVTEAHLLLAEQLIQDTKLSSIAQLIADSEARATYQLRAEAELKEARRIVTEQSNLRLIAEDGMNHVTALKNKIHERYQSDLASKEAELATERAKVQMLREDLAFYDAS